MVPITSPNTSASTADSTDIQPKIRFSSLRPWRRSRATIQILTAITHRTNNMGPREPATVMNSERIMTSAPFRICSPAKRESVAASPSYSSRSGSANVTLYLGARLVVQ